jgi:hypothetical protein
LRKAMRGNILVDLRNVYQPVLAHAAGFVYCGVGRGSLSRGISSASDQSHEPSVYHAGAVLKTPLVRLYSALATTHVLPGSRGIEIATTASVTPAASQVLYRAERSAIRAPPRGLVRCLAWPMRSRARLQMSIRRS